MILPALLLAAAIEPALIDRTVRVPAGEFRTLPIAPRNLPGLLTVQYSVDQGAAVRLLVIEKASEPALRAGRETAFAAGSPFGRKGTVQAPLDAPADYALVIDNRAEHRTQSFVQVQGAFAYRQQKVEPRTLTWQRQAVLIAASWACFFGIAWFAGRRVWAATLARRNSGRPPR